MTDNEIIKALECCVIGKDCYGCPLDTDNSICFEKLRRDALDLINRQKAKIKEFGEKIVVQKGLIDRQKAEIEMLRGEVKEKTETIDFLKKQVVGWNNDYCELKTQIKTAKAEAIKEFAERFMDECLAYPLNDGDLTILVSKRDFDNLVKEKIGTDFTQMFMGVDKLKPLPSIDVKEMVGDNDE